MILIFVKNPTSCFPGTIRSPEMQFAFVIYQVLHNLKNQHTKLLLTRHRTPRKNTEALRNYSVAYMSVIADE